MINKQFIVIFIVTTIVIISILCCTKSNPFNLYVPDDYVRQEEWDFAVWFDESGFKSYDGVLNHEGWVLRGYDYQSLHSISSIVVNKIEYTNIMPYYFDFISFLPDFKHGEMLNIRVNTSKSPTQVNFRLPYQLIEVDFPENYDYKQPFTLRWKMEGNNTFTVVSGNTFYETDHAHYDSDIGCCRYYFSEIVSPNARMITIPAMVLANNDNPIYRSILTIVSYSHGISNRTYFVAHLSDSTKSASYDKNGDRILEED